MRIHARNRLRKCGRTKPTVASRYRIGLHFSINERNRADFDKNPDKYAPLNGYAGQLFLVGELVE